MSRKHLFAIVVLLGAAAVAGLPQDRFGVGGAMNQTARQIGAVLGVAILIAVLGTPGSATEALTHFRAAWLVGVVAALSSAVVSSFQRRPAETGIATAAEVAAVEIAIA